MTREIITRSAVGASIDKANRDKTVMKMAERMIRVLDDNNHKSGWDEFAPLGAMYGLRNEIKELDAEMTAYEYADRFHVPDAMNRHLRRVGEEALDVANWIMFLLYAIEQESEKRGDGK
jgi:NTP pyrophosphatase (non-canonical NTP hydrolase)